MYPAVRYLLIVVIVYAAYCALLFILQRHMLFPRHMTVAPDLGRHLGAVERIWLPLGPDRVEAWLLPANNASTEGKRPLIIFAHGNGELIDFWASEFASFTRLGMHVLLVEYPGYGRSGGKPSQAAITATFTNAYDVVVKRPDVDPQKIILLGRSVGGGAVCALARERPSAALILMSSFTSVRYFARQYLAPGFLVRDPFDNLAAVRDYPNPVLVVHGRHDEIIPFKHGQALHRAARQGHLVVYDSGHNDCPPNWQRFVEDVSRFLHRYHIIARPIGSS